MDINEYISSGIVELYVLELCSEEEKTEMETLRKQHPAVNEAIGRYEMSLEEGLLTNGILPPAAVDEKALQRIDNLQAPVIALPRFDKSEKNPNWLKFAAAAAVILLLGSAVLNFVLYRKLDRQSAIIQKEEPLTLPETDYAVMMNPAITPVAMYGVGIHAICRCTLYWDKKTRKAYIMIHHLAKSPSSREYQLWAMVDGKPVSVGLIDESIRGRFIELSKVPPNAKGFLVTLETAGGNDSPTENQTYLRGTI